MIIVIDAYLHHLVCVYYNRYKDIEHKVYKETNEGVEVKPGEIPDSIWSAVINNAEGHKHVITVNQ